MTDAEQFFMVDVYGKNEKDDLSAAERKALSDLVRELKKQAKRAHGPRRQS